MPVGVLLESVLHSAILCLLVAGNLEIKLRLPRLSVFTEETCLYAVFYQFQLVDFYHGLADTSLCTQQYKTRQSMYSSNVHSVLRTKAEIIFIQANH